jgi:hypothetical protein
VAVAIVATVIVTTVVGAINTKATAAIASVETVQLQ